LSCRKTEYDLYALNHVTALSHKGGHESCHNARRVGAFVCAAVRAAEQRILERVNIALSLTFLSSALIVSTATMLTLIAYTSAGNDLSPVQVTYPTYLLT